MHDPWRETDPRWQPHPMSIECQLQRDLREYIEEETHRQIVRQRQPKAALPHGMYLNELGDGRWCLIFPDGGSGYRSLIGTREDLLDIVSQLTTTT